MLQQKVLELVVSVLEQCGIEYMITGSVASSLQGEPRTSHDIDVVVNIPRSAVTPLVHSFPAPRFYITDESVNTAIKQHTMFNVIDVLEGDKIDFWVLTDDPFDQSRFHRKQQQSVFGISLYVSRPEDTILMKLKWAKESGGSEKQFGDALRVYELQYKNLDIVYIEHWVPILKVHEAWERIQREANPLQ